MAQKPHSNFVGPLLTDLYELTMAFAYFRQGKHKQKAVFDLFFRKNPFDGEFTLFGGLTEVLRFVDNFKFTDKDIEYVGKVVPGATDRFLDWLRSVDCSDVRLYAPPEGSVVFPRIPLIRIEGPLGIVQILESAMLNLVAFPSLIATNAARMRLAAGEDKKLVEFGLRRAQGPDGAMSASRYSYLGGFDGTSNSLAASMFDIEASGTQAHAYVQSFVDLDDLDQRELTDKDGNKHDFAELCLKYHKQINNGNTHKGELASFIGYAQTFPEAFLALVDTYDTLESGVPNFLAVALALKEIGYEPLGLRLDSGDLAHLSRETRRMFKETADRFDVDFSDLKIVASNEINEVTIRSLNEQGHEIDIYGIGTHLVTCQAQPSLGCVYKLVEVDDQPRIKLSQEPSKMIIPGRKTAYRLYGEAGCPLVDLMTFTDEDPPKEGDRVLCCHPFDETKRVFVYPNKVQKLHRPVWDGKITVDEETLDQRRDRAIQQLKEMRDDHLRPINPTPYKVSLSEDLYEYTRKIWRNEAPVREMR